ncbi:hypothetical protein [Nonomuraea typhae]|uniref:Glycosyl transferase n=1 Tax=Nonomuraea typhae TaxID=2603600 RepID=A0ABW7YNT6_9ACTN
MRRGRRADAAFALGYLALAGYVLSGLWSGGYLVDGGQDQTQWEWFFAVTARNVAGGDFLLFTTLQNHPLGVNLMANTVMLGLSVPLTPLTLLLGPSATWTVVLTLGLAGSAFAWYWLLSRHVVASRAAAGIGAAFCGFAPPIVSHANAHPNFVVLFVIPLICARVVALRRRRRVLRDGTLLGLLAAYQVFLGEEALLLAFAGLAVFCLGYGLAAFCPGYGPAGPEAALPALRPVLGGVCVAALVCVALTGAALVYQFTGPQSYDGLIHGPAGNDVKALVAHAGRSLAGEETVAGSLSMNRTEQNAFFGWPLAVLTIGIVLWLRRKPVVVGSGLAAFTGVVLSLGPEVTFGGTGTGFIGPWRFLSGLPLFESVLESRFTLVTAAAAGILLAVAADHALALSWTGLPVRTLLCLALAEALVPVFPLPLAAGDRAHTPAFFTTGAWRAHVAPGRSLVPAPPPDAGDATALRWQIDAGLGFPLPEGYFAGPYGPDRQGVYGVAPRPTATLLREVRDTGRLPAIGAEERRRAREDLAFWQADAVVLGPHERQEALRDALTRLLGEGRQEGGVWVWDV